MAKSKLFGRWRIPRIFQFGRGRGRTSPGFGSMLRAKSRGRRRRTVKR